MGNPLLSDRNVDFLLYEVLEVDRRLGRLPAFAEHGRETFDLYVAGARRLAREVLLPSYRAIDAEPPRLVDGRVQVHPRLREIYPQLVALGLTSATRPAAVGGQQLPMAVAALAHAYLMAGNLSAVGYVGLDGGGGASGRGVRLATRSRSSFMTRMYAGRVDRHHGAHRAARRLQPRRRGHARDADAETPRRPLPPIGLQDLHLRRRSRSDREHRADDAGAHRRRAGRDQGRVAVRRAQSPPRRPTARSSTTTCASRGHGAQDRLARPAEHDPQLRRGAATVAAGSSASPTAASTTCSR